MSAYGHEVRQEMGAPSRNGRALPAATTAVADEIEHEA
jgi:hypothetical protein